jgi:hypothetical protein
MKKFYLSQYESDEGLVNVYASDYNFSQNILSVIYENTSYNVLTECKEVYLTEAEYKNAKQTYNNILYFDRVGA